MQNRLKLERLEVRIDRHVMRWLKATAKKEMVNLSIVVRRCLTDNYIEDTSK